MCAATKKLLIVSVGGIGNGHLRASEAVLEALRARHPGVQATHVDILDYTSPLYLKLCLTVYSSLIHRFPSLWSSLYGYFEEQKPEPGGKGAMAVLNRIAMRRFSKYVAEYEPDTVLCTHYMPAEFLSHAWRAGRLKASMSVLLTDYEIHTMWIQSGVERYFVATEEMAFGLEEKGIGTAVAQVTGIPTASSFCDGGLDREGLRTRLGLAPDKATVLVTAGGYGVRGTVPVVSYLAEHLPEVQFLAVAGNNARLRGQLAEIEAKFPGRVFPYAYVDNMHELMAVSDVMVSKSGGLATTECLIAGLPMVVYKPITGHEERNARFLLEQGAGLWAQSAAQVLFKVKILLEDPERLARMRAAARAAARPGAADEIAGALLR